MADSASTEIVATKAPAKKKTASKEAPARRKAKGKKAAKAKPRKKAKATKTTRKKTSKKTKSGPSKKAKATKTTRKKTSKKTKSGRGRNPNTWDLVTLDEIIAYKNASGLSDKQLAKQFGVSSIARMKTGAAPVTETQQLIRKVIDGKGVAANKTPPASASTPARKPSGKSGRRTPSEGLTLLMQAILDEDWGLARAAYDKLK